jgi:hypothetical protein
MTLSNFAWTDKTSVKWFIMLPTGHEGPYSLLSLMKRKMSPDVKVWAEGLPEAILFKIAVKKSQEIIEEVIKVTEPAEEDEIPPLPVPSREIEFIPPVPDTRSYEEKTDIAPEKNYKFQKLVGLVLGVTLVVFFGLKEWVKTQEVFSFNRAAGMSTELYERINSHFKFDGWEKKIFFKEYVPADMSRIWLVTSSFQTCQIEASFSSVKEKLLSNKDEKIIFRASARLKDHLAEFSSFNFVSGHKILPGLYEMDLKAHSCSWDGLAPKWGNLFKAADPTYVTRMKVVLYHKGNVEFISVLDQLINKKIKTELKTQNQEELFWQDYQQKLQTLLAISLQIEQLLLDFVESPPVNFRKNLKTAVDKYTRNYGLFLTEFVVANEKYFNELEKSEISDLINTRDYENIIRINSKNIGLESMKLIEQLQTWKNPNKKDLARIETKIIQKFETLKGSLNQRIIEMTEDRTR